MASFGDGPGEDEGLVQRPRLDVRVRREIRRREQAEAELEAERLRAAKQKADFAELRDELRQTKHRLKGLQRRRLIRVALWFDACLRVATTRRRNAAAALAPATKSVAAAAPGRGPSAGERDAERSRVKARRRTAPVLPNSDDVGSRASCGYLMHANPVTVVLPVFGASALVSRCLESLLRNTTSVADLLIIDDASTDPQVTRLLDQIEQTTSHVRVISNSTNYGFVRSVNIAFAETSGDVIVLNSDTEVPPRWLENLRRVAYSDPTIGTVTPVTNNAGAFSTPDAGAANALPGPIDVVGRRVNQRARRLNPSTPTGHGFCIYIKRDVISSIGGFDVQSFPRGYGEENDFCMRAASLGWRHVVDDSTFVVHAGGASFGDERSVLRRAARERMDALHPDYHQAVTAFRRSPEMASVRESVRSAFVDVSSGLVPRPRVLYILHDGQGGTPMSNADLMGSIGRYYEPMLFRGNGTNFQLSAPESSETLRDYQLPRPLEATDFKRRDYAQLLESILVDYAIEMVHVRHLLKHTFDVSSVSRALGIPLIVSLHDFFYCCPTVHLMDDLGVFCGGRCTPGQGSCPTPTWFANVPHLKHGWVHEWRDHSRQILNQAHALVIATQSVKDVYRSVFPEVDNDRYCVIEHGRNLRQYGGIGQFPEGGEPIRLLLLGDVSMQKGAMLLADIQELDTEGRLEFHLVGSLSRAAAASLEVVDHGRYERDQFRSPIGDLRPAAVAALSIVGETYSHTLTEAWSLGLPVLASPLGAIGERVGKRGGGWIIDVSQPENAYRQILACFERRDEWELRQREAHVYGLPTVQTMAERYAELYNDVIARQRPFQRTASFAMNMRHSAWKRAGVDR